MSQELLPDGWCNSKDRCLNYEGAMSDLDSALDVLIRRINGEADLASAAEWVRLNYPKRTHELRPRPVAVRVEEIADLIRQHIRVIGYYRDRAPPIFSERGIEYGARAIVALLNPPPTEFAKPTGCDNPVERGRSEGPASATGDSPVGAGLNPSPTEAHRGTEPELTGEGNYEHPPEAQGDCASSASTSPTGEKP